MKLEINIDNYPKQKEEILKSLKSKFLKKNPNKKFIETDVKFSYDYCMKIGGNNEYVSFKEYMENTFSGSYNGSYGRFYSNSLGEFPQELIDIIKKDFDEKHEKEGIEKKKQNFISEILTSVGKTPHFNNENISGCVSLAGLINSVNLRKSEIYPTIEELKKVKPEIYNKYLKLTEDMKIVFFAPGNKDADEFGFVVHKVDGAYRKINGSSIIIVTDKPINTFELFDNETDTAYWKFDQSHVNTTKKFHNAKPDSDFIGSHRGKYHRLSDVEVKSHINKILHQGVDINRNPQRGITNHGGGLFQINI